MVQLTPLRVHPIAIGILFASLLTVSATAKQTCQEIQAKKGEAAYQKCLNDEQEQSIKDQVAAYKITLDQRRQTVKDYYTTLTNEENYAWNDIQLRLKAEQSDRKLQIKDLERNKDQNVVAIQEEKNALSRIQKIIGLTQTSHNQNVKRLKLRQDAELHELDAALTDYELQLRQAGISAL